MTTARFVALKASQIMPDNEKRGIIADIVGGRVGEWWIPVKGRVNTTPQYGWKAVRYGKAPAEPDCLGFSAQRELRPTISRSTGEPATAALYYKV